MVKFFRKLWYGLRNINFKQLMKIFIFVLLVGFLIFNIVNNGNILTDGCRYRRRPRIEM